MSDAAKKIDARIDELGDWRGEYLARIRELISRPSPMWSRSGSGAGFVWYRDGMICTGADVKSHVEVMFAKGASLDDPSGLSTPAWTERPAAPSILRRTVSWTRRRSPPLCGPLSASTRDETAPGGHVCGLIALVVVVGCSASGQCPAAGLVPLRRALARSAAGAAGSSSAAVLGASSSAAGAGVSTTSTTPSSYGGYSGEPSPGRRGVRMCAAPVFSVDHVAVGRQLVGADTEHQPQGSETGT